MTKRKFMNRLEATKYAFPDQTWEGGNIMANLTEDLRGVSASPEAETFKGRIQYAPTTTSMPTFSQWQQM